MLELQGFFDDAEPIYSQALEIVVSLEGDNSPAAVPILVRLGSLYRGGPVQFGYFERALAIQRESFPDDIAAFAELAVEVCNVMTRGPEGRSRAGEILRPVLENLEEALGADSPHLVPVLIALAKAEAEVGNDSRQLRRADSAIKIAEDAFPEDSVLLADLALEIGRDLLSMSRSPNSEKYLEEALKGYERALGPDDARTAIAAMSLGELRFASLSPGAGIVLLENALDYFSGNRQYQAQELRIRALLVEYYEQSGRSDDATPHLMAMGRLTVFSNNQEYLPIYKAIPNYPPRDAARGREGTVVIQYTVDTAGRTRDHVINGEPVEVPEVTTAIVFKMGN
jgi:tetratricopeptide (TPR) repeat protein